MELEVRSPLRSEVALVSVAHHNLRLGRWFLLGPVVVLLAIMSGFLVTGQLFREPWSLALVIIFGIGGMYLVGRWAGPNDRVYLQRIFLLAYVLRVGVAFLVYFSSISAGREGFLSFHDDRFWFVSGESALQYLRSGGSVVRMILGQLYIPDVDFLHPARSTSQVAYPLFGALVMAVGGGHLLVFNLMNCFLGSLLVGPVYLMARELSGVSQAKVAVLVVVFSEGLMWSAINLRDTQIAFVTTLLFLLLIYTIKRKDSTYLIGVCFCLLWLVLLRGVWGVFCILASLFVLLMARVRRTLWRIVLVGVLAAGMGWLLWSGESLLPLALGLNNLESFADLRTTAERAYNISADTAVGGSSLIYSLYQRYAGTPLLLPFSLALGSALSVMRPPTLPSPDELFGWPSRFLWIGVFVPLLLVGIRDVLSGTLAKDKLNARLFLGIYFVAIIIAAIGTASGSSRYLYPVIGIEATLVGIGSVRLGKWTSFQTLWLVVVLAVTGMYLLVKLGT